MYSLRRATKDDVLFLVDVVVAATRAQGRLPADFDEAEFRVAYAEWTAEHIAAASGHSETSVIEVGGRSVGRLRVVRTGSAIELAGIQILPGAQSQGIGSRIVADLITEATADARPLSLSVESDNPRARDLYQRLGFVETGRTDAEITMAYRSP